MERVGAVTTIAYRDGIVAADSQLNLGNIKVKSSPKIVLLSSGEILAAAGWMYNIAKAQAFFDQKNWRDKLDDAPEFEEGFDAILFSKGKPYYCSRNCIPFPVEHPFFAIGSGTDIALAAMYTGMSAPDAVLLASELDIYTNNKVQIVNVQDAQKEAAAKRAGRTISRKAASKAIN